jgi:O-antigen ligase
MTGLRLGNRPLLTRGGLARRQRTAPVAPSVQPRSPEEDLFPANPLEGFKLNLALIGLSLYLLAMTSVRIPVGDIAIGLALVGVMTQPGGIKVPPVSRFLALFALWALLAGLQSSYPGQVSNGITDLVKLWIIGMLVYNALQTRVMIRLFMLVYLACFVLFPVRGTLITFFVLGERDEGRAYWIQLYGNPNDLAAILLLQLSMLIAFLAAEPKGWVRKIATSGFLLFPGLILLTQSRGVFLGLIAFLGIVLAGQKRRMKVMLQMAVLTVMLIPALPPEVWERLGTLKKATSTSTLHEVDGSGGSTKQRFEIWQVARKIIRENPVTGIGYNAYKEAHLHYSQGGEFTSLVRGRWNTHSLYLNVLAETGYPGMLIYLLMIAGVLVPAELVRRKSKTRFPVVSRQLLVLEAGALAFLIACIFGHLAFLVHFHIHLMLIAAMTAVQARALKPVNGTSSGAAVRTHSHAPLQMRANEGTA